MLTALNYSYIINPIKIIKRKLINFRYEILYLNYYISQSILNIYFFTNINYLEFNYKILFFKFNLFI